MIESDGWETVYQTAPVIERCAKADARQMLEYSERQDCEFARLSVAYEEVVTACAMEYLREVIAKALERK